MTWLVIPAAVLALGLAVEVRRYRRLYKQASAQLRASERRARHHERLARHTLTPRTGQVAAAPRLAPLADVVPFPDRDDRPAA